MCIHCDAILYGLCLLHDADHCPLRGSMYCPSCASYGHTPKECPDPPGSSPDIQRRILLIENPLTRKQKRAVEVIARRETQRVVYLASKKETERIEK